MRNLHPAAPLEKWRTCKHEAAHAAAIHRLSDGAFPLIEVRVDRPAPDRAGNVRFEHPEVGLVEDPEVRAAIVRALLIVKLVAPIVERLAGWPPLPYYLALESSTEQLGDFLREYEVDSQTYYLAVHDAYELAAAPAFQQEWSRLAVALNERPVLTGDEVEEILTQEDE